MSRRTRPLRILLPAMIALLLASSAHAAKFGFARIYIEYNASANDLGFHVTLDGENWSELSIVNPDGITVFDVEGSGAYEDLGMTELFFEGAEPNLDDFPLEDLLALFPEGKYKFSAEKVEGGFLRGASTLTHAVPAGPVVSSDVDDDEITIRWQGVTAPPPGFPDRQIVISGYQIIVEPFQVTLPASSRQVTLPPEFAESLAPGEHPFEVLAIEAGGNQTITEGTFVTD